MSQKGQPGAGIDMFYRYFQTEPITVNNKLFLLPRKLGRGTASFATQRRQHGWREKSHTQGSCQQPFNGCLASANQMVVTECGRKASLGEAPEPVYPGSDLGQGA